MVRAEMPGADPERDIEVSVAAGVLHIRAERHGNEASAEGDAPTAGSEYGSFSCHVPLPEGLTDEDIKASYRDGVLEVRALVPECLTAATQHQRLPISHG
ncbi:alpha-crystallin [Arthrobacter sp. Hiyo6]|nr:alpha-crystallin [Arthrobacter sp. Hiyo6]